MGWVVGSSRLIAFVLADDFCCGWWLLLFIMADAFVVCLSWLMVVVVHLSWHDGFHCSFIVPIALVVAYGIHRGWWLWWWLMVFVVHCDWWLWWWLIAFVVCCGSSWLMAFILANIIIHTGLKGWIEMIQASLMMQYWNSGRIQLMDLLWWKCLVDWSCAWWLLLLAVSVVVAAVLMLFFFLWWHENDKKGITS